MLAESFTNSSRFQAMAAASTDEALSVINSGRIQIALISADLDDGQSLGIQFAQTVHARHPNLALVILLDRARRDAVIQAFRAGARGVFSRTEPIDDFLRCVDQVSRGEIGIGRAESDFLLHALKSIPAPKIASMNGESPLTKRELQVVQHAARGYTNKVIADKLGLSEHTVKNYLFRSFAKLGVSSRVELLFLLTMEGNTTQFECEPSLDDYCRKAEKGFRAAKRVLDIVSEEGWGPHKSVSDAYVWLRLAESYSHTIISRSQLLAEYLSHKLSTEQIRLLEPQVQDGLRRFSTEDHREQDKLQESESDNLSDLKTA